MRLTIIALLLLIPQIGPVATGLNPSGQPAVPSGDIRQVIRAQQLPADQPYSSGILAADTLYLSGQPGRNPVTGDQPEGIAAQTRQAMENLGLVLRAAGMDYPHLVKCHVYLRTMEDYAGMNKVYGGFFSGRVPARTTVEAGGLPSDAGVQIDCVAYRDISRISVVNPPRGSLPAPLGPYSAAVWAGDTLYLSGMGGQFPEDRRLPEALGQQVTQTLVNIETTLEAAGLGLSDVVASNVYLTPRAEAGELAPAYARSFRTHPVPPRGLIFLPRLPGEIKTEITMVATRQTVSRQIIPGPSGGETRGLVAGGVLYTRAESAQDLEAGFEEQFRGVLRRLDGTLHDAGLGRRDVNHVRVYLADLADMASMDRIFRETFPDAPPARTTLQELPGGAERVKAALVATRPVQK